MLKLRQLEGEMAGSKLKVTMLEQEKDELAQVLQAAKEIIAKSKEAFDEFPDTMNSARIRYHDGEDRQSRQWPLSSAMGPRRASRQQGTTGSTLNVKCQTNAPSSAQLDS